MLAPLTCGIAVGALCYCEVCVVGCAHLDCYDFAGDSDCKPPNTVPIRCRLICYASELLRIGMALKSDSTC